jgi:hypothetical protein
LFKILAEEHMFGEKSAQTMVEAAKSLKAKEAAKPNS